MKLITEIKVNGKYVPSSTHQMTNEEIYKRLCDDLIAKKINQCRYIRSIKRRNNYNGTQTITITYDNNVRNICTIPCH